MKQTHRGSCHCGAVRFECELDLADGTSKCNCSICTKQRFWKAIVTPDAFRLLQGADALTEYTFNRHAIHHRFCRHCGVKPFGQAEMPGLGPFYAINVVCLDDVAPEQLAGAPVEYQDGRHDRYDHVPTEVGHL